jgi:MoaA/NifB/PqqE/SkfB family radical SAM enzyme
VGIYNNIPFFDTIENAKKVFFGESKNKEMLKFSLVKQLQLEKGSVHEEVEYNFETRISKNYSAQIPDQVRDFPENYDYINLYPNWLAGNLRLSCNSILDSLIVLPDGSVPICQNLNIKLGNVHEKTLDEIFNSEASVHTQQHYSKNCNQCWISYHRKYDIALYKNFEKIFGRTATSKLLGYYQWDSGGKSYSQAVP